MNKKPFFVGLLVAVGCAAWLAGCTVDETESSDGSQPSPNCGILACPYGTQCAFDEWGEASCMAPPGTTCSAIDCGEYFHCEMTTNGAVCAAGGAEL